jgi:hypothetical protein
MFPEPQARVAADRNHFFRDAVKSTFQVPTIRWPEPKSGQFRVAVKIFVLTTAAYQQKIFLDANG